MIYRWKAHTAAVKRVVCGRTLGTLAVLGALSLAMVGSSCTTGVARFTGGSATEPNVRVLVHEGGSTVDVTSTAGLVVQSLEGMRVVRAPAGRVTVTARGSSANVEVSDGRSAALDGSVRLVAERGSVMSVAGIRYAGILRVDVIDDGAVRVVNVVPMEQYLEGVLPHEIGNPGPDGFDAVKSQAVAARTYAFQKIQQKQGEPFDVYASVQDQVYRGLEGNTPVASDAIRQTRGRVLDYGGEPARAYYSACCGGHTSDIRRVWPDREPAPYLTGVYDRRTRDGRAFCSAYKKFRWRFSFTGREMGDILRETLPRELGVPAQDVGVLVDMRVERRTDSGRVIALTVETTEKTFQVNGDRIRWVLMPDATAGRILPSVMFRLDKVMERDRIAFLSIAGGGNGHGVGMCQNGAVAMARQGYTYDMILGHYYPGTAVSRRY